MFFEQAGSSFNFLAENIVDREMFGGWDFPVGWFQSVNSARDRPARAAGRVDLGRDLGRARWSRRFRASSASACSFNALAFLVLMFALVEPGRCAAGMIPFWTLCSCYVIQTVGELCLSPIGLSMVTKLAPVRLVGFAHGRLVPVDRDRQQPVGHLRRTRQRRNRHDRGIGALSGFTFSFWLLLGAGVFLFLIAPLINKLMHGVR